MRAVVHAVRTAEAAGCSTIVLTNGCGGLNPAWGPGTPVLISDHINLTARVPARGSDLRRPHRPLLRTAARDRPRGRPDPRRGRLRPVPRAALRDAGRGADGQAHRRRPRRHVDGARGDRGPSGRAWRSSASRWSPTWPPASPTSRCPTRGASRPARPPPSGAVGCSPTSCGGCGVVDGRRRPRRRGSQAWRGRGPRPGHPRRSSTSLLAAADDGRSRGGRRPRGPVRRDARVRHGGPARRARRRTQPDEPRRRPPGGGGPRGVPADRAAHPREPDGRRRVRRALQLGRLRARHRGRRGRRRRAGLDAARGRCRRRCWPSRSGTSAPTRASWSRRATTRRRTTATRSTSATAARSCRRPTRRSPRTSPPSRRSRDLPLVDDGWENLGDEVQDAYVARVAAIAPGSAPATYVSVVHTALHGVGDDTVRRGVRRSRASPRRRRSTSRPCRPGLPDRSASRTPRRPAPSTLALAVAREVAPRRRHRQRPGRRPVRRGGARRTVAWRMLRGDEVGALLGARVDAARCSHRTPWSPARSCRPGCSSALAASAGLGTRRRSPGSSGSRASPGLGFGYEEALGYCVAPDIVRDKDGVSAALLLAGRRGAQGRGPHPPRRARRHRGRASACTRPTPSRSASPTSPRSRRSWSGCGPHRRASSGR